MPRGQAKNQKAAGGIPLAGCTITFADKRTSIITQQHPDLATKQFSQIEKEISDCGGNVTTKVVDSTHLVATGQQYGKKLQKIKEAIDDGTVKIVDIAWLVESLKGTKVDEAPYLLHGQSDDTKPATNGLQSDIPDEPREGVKPSTEKSKTKSKSRKRSLDDTENEQDDAKKAKTSDVKSEPTQDAPAAKLGKVRVPVDDGLYRPEDYTVCINDEDSVAWDATLNQTNTGNNNNKFYRIQILKHQNGKHFCWTRWGRVGENGQNKLLGSSDAQDAEREFKKKFKDKNGNHWEDREKPIKSGKYTFIELNYEESDDESDGNAATKAERKTSNGGNEEDDAGEIIGSKLPDRVQRLMEFIFNTEFIRNTLADLNYDAAKMPLGKLSKKTLLRGYEVLKEMAALVGSSNTNAVSHNHAQQLQDLSDQYFSIIPHDFRRNRPPTISNINMIQKEITVLENLTDMQLANEIMKHAKDNKKDVERVNILDRQYSGLGMQEMASVDPNSKEFKELENYLIKTSADSHMFKHTIQDIFRIERNGEFDRFDQSEYAKLPKKSSDRRLLWHGSRCTNYGGILSQGLRIAPPEAPVSGYMFGKGVYLADMSSKSANYCCSGMSNDTGLLLLCEVELGKPSLRLSGGDYHAGERAKQQNSISTFGLGRTAPPKWKDASCIHKNLKGVTMPDIKYEPCDTDEKGVGLGFNEYIVYDVAQIKLRYLLRVEMKYQHNW